MQILWNKRRRWIGAINKQPLLITRQRNGGKHDSCPTRLFFSLLTLQSHVALQQDVPESLSQIFSTLNFNSVTILLILVVQVKRCRGINQGNIHFKSF